MLLAEMLGNELFGMNGVLQEELDVNGYHFRPHDFEQSGEIIQKRVREKDYMRMKPRAGERITIDGRAVANWDDLEKRIETKAEELMGKLDPLVKEGDFTLQKKDQWLTLMNKEVSEFKEQNPIEITKPRLGGWANEIELRRMLDSDCSPKL